MFLNGILAPPCLGNLASIFTIFLSCFQAGVLFSERIEVEERYLHIGPDDFVWGDLEETRRHSTCFVVAD